MQKSSGNRDRIDRLLILVSLIGVIVFLFMLYNDSFVKTGKATGPQIRIGALKKPKLDVRRRFQDEFIWLPITDMELVYLGDSIFTGKDSSASVILDSGVNLWIDPDSLVVLDKKSELMKLDLKFGAVRGQLGDKPSTSLQLLVNNQNLDLTGQHVEFALNKDKSNETKLRVIEGVAKVTESKTKKVTSLAKSQGFKMGRGIASIPPVVNLADQPTFVRQDQWAANRNIWFAQKQKLQFTWQTEGPVDHFELMIAPKANLKTPFVKETLKVNGFEFDAPFDEGTLYWQVKAFGNDNSVIESEVIQWNVGLLLAPEWQDQVNPLSLPAAEFKSLQSGQSSSYLLKWRSSLKAVQYRLEWSKDSEFKDKQVVEVKDKSWALPKLDIGTIYVRVRSENLGRPASVWSNTQIIEVTEKDPDGLVAPKIATPNIETLEKTGVPQIEWPSEGNNQNYLVEVSNKQDFSQVLQSVTIKEPKWLGSAKPLGTYFVRIFPLASSGRRGPVSPLIIWSARSEAPKWLVKSNPMIVSIPRDKNDKLGIFPPTQLMWKDSSRKTVAEFLFEKDLNEDFGKKEDGHIKEAKITLENLTPGSYFYRTRSIYSDGSQSLASTVLRVDVLEQQADGLVSPLLSQKAFKSALDGDNPAVVKLNWNDQASATNYKIQVASDPQFTKMVFEKASKTSGTDLQVGLQGTFYIRVAGISKAERIGPWSGAAEWQIAYGVPVLNSMVTVKASLADANAPLPPTFAPISWRGAKGIQQFLVEIKSKASGTVVLSEKIKGSNYKWKINKADLYSVRVKGITEEGKDLTSFAQPVEFKFVVSYPIKPPELLLPKDKVSYILSKMKNPQIWLEWNADKLATSYKIEIAKDKSFAKVIHTLTSEEKKVLLDHKVIRGKLYWRVQAINDELKLQSAWSSAWSVSVVDIENED